MLGVAERVRDQVMEEEGGVAASMALRGLANRLFGFELLIGPYAVAHYRLHHALRVRPPDDGEEEPQFRGSHSKEAHLKVSDGVRGQVDLQAEQEIGDHENGRHGRRHVSGCCKSAEQRQRPDGVNDVIDVVSEPRTLLLPHPGQRAIQAVTEPVQRETQRGEQ